MVAGYFLHRPEAAPWCDKIYIRKQVERYVVSFFIWSSIFFLLVHHEGILKNIVRTVYAGYNNITPYGYPFWFINALLVGGFTLTCIRWGKEMVNRRGGGEFGTMDCSDVSYRSIVERSAMDIASSPSFAVESRSNVWSDNVYGHRCGFSRLCASLVAWHSSGVLLYSLCVLAVVRRSILSPQYEQYVLFSSIA